MQNGSVPLNILTNPYICLKILKNRTYNSKRKHFSHIYIYIYIYTFLSSLVCNTRLHPNALYKVHFTYVISLFSPLPLSPVLSNSRYDFLKTDYYRVVYSASFCPISSLHCWAKFLCTDHCAGAIIISFYVGQLLAIATYTKL